MRYVPLIKDLVLVGGGHTHALLIRRWGMKPLPGVRVTLVSRDVLTPYSGMLPGMIAGQYSTRDTHIDLQRLCRWAGVRFICASVTGIDRDKKELHLEPTSQPRPALGYDLVSINTGSTPARDGVEGAEQNSVPVKPVNQFSSHWWQLRQRLESNPADKALQVAVVGAGVGGFELLLSVRHALREHQLAVRLHWIVRGESPLMAQPEKVRRLALAECAAQGVEVHCEFNVLKVSTMNDALDTALDTAQATANKQLVSTSGAVLTVDEVLWATAASAPDWPAAGGLDVDKRGFISVNPFLQSSNDAAVFACGDVASMPEPVAKAGVFAVRQAPVLFKNLRAQLLGGPLSAYHAQNNVLSLISLGHRTAIASRNGFSVKGAWVWKWKHHIDTRFMDQFRDLPVRKMNPVTLEQVPRALLRASHQLSSSASPDSSHVFCGGCGAKVGPQVLEAVLSSLKPVPRTEILSGMEIHEDASVLDPGGALVVQSVDQFRAMLDDPWLFGRIAALHALSDVYASGATPLSAMALLTLPFAEADLQKRDTQQLLAGAVYELNSANCALSGGHTGVGPELMMGFSVNGLSHRDTAEQAYEFQKGDKIIITKPAGIGVVLAADMRSEAEGEHVQQAVDLMLQSNDRAANIFRQHSAVAMTDVTGFGVLGHLLNLLDKVGASASLDLEAMPLLDAALQYSAQGISSSLYAHNEHYLARLTGVVDSRHQLRIPLLLDPQTNGGLLAIVAADKTDACLAALNAAAYIDPSSKDKLDDQQNDRSHSNGTWADAAVIGVIDSSSASAVVQLRDCVAKN